MLIDMDGVILDNTYDNNFWQNQIPEVIAQNKRISFDDAKELAIQIFNYKKNTKDWYDVDYWSNMLDIDIEAQKRSEQSFSKISLYDGVPKDDTPLVDNATTKSKEEDIGDKIKKVNFILPLHDVSDIRI